MKQFTGTGVALVTPFRRGKVDYVALARVVEHVIAGGVDFLVVLGTTGEAAMLSEKEEQEVLQFIIKTNAGRLPLVIGHFGGNNTAQLVAKLQQYDYQGVDAIMAASPAYVKPTQEGIFQHYMQLAAASPLPIIIYNVPGRTASNIEAKTILRLAETSDKFVAVKEASGDMTQGAQIIKNCPEHFAILSGDDPTALSLMACGADGGISVIANALPTLFSDLIRATLNNDWHTARQIHLDLLDIHPLLYVEGNPVGVKGALKILKICRKEVRLPLVSISDETYLELEKELRKIRQSRILAR